MLGLSPSMIEGTYCERFDMMQNVKMKEEKDERREDEKSRKTPTEKYQMTNLVRESLFQFYLHQRNRQKD